MANAFSNPAHYAQFKPVQTENWEVATQLAMFKRAEYDKGQAEVDQWINALASVPIDNKEANAHFRDRVSTVLSEVDRMASAESLTNKGSRQKILSNIASAVDDITLNAISASRAKRNYDAQWEAIKGEKLEFFNSDNYEYGKAGYNDYINAKKDANVGDYVKNGFEVIPFTDLQARMDKTTMELIKQKGKKEYSIDMHNEAGEVIGQRQMVEVGFNDSQLQNILSSSLKDPNAMAQMKVNAWKNYGGFSEEGVSKLTTDYTKFIEGKKDSFESKRDYYKNLLSDTSYTEEQKKEFKEQVDYFEKELTELPTHLNNSLKEISEGRYTNASSQIYQDMVIDSGRSKFGTIYDKYQTGVKADEIYWKNQDYNLAMSKHQYDKYVHEKNWQYKEMEIAQKDRELQMKEAENNPQGEDIIWTDRAFEPESKDPLVIIDKEVLDTAQGFNSSVKTLIGVVDDQLRSDNTDELTKKEAQSLKNAYINHLYNTAKKNGKEINKDYMRKLSVQEIVNNYESGEFKGSNFFSVAKLNKNAITNLTLIGNEDVLKVAEEKAKIYQVSAGKKEKANAEYNKILQSSIYTKSFLSKVMQEETTVLSGGKAVKAKEAYKNILESDGTFKKGVTESQKNKVITELNNTYEAQKSYRLSYTSKAEAEKMAVLLGGKASDVILRKGSTKYTTNEFGQRRSVNERDSYVFKDGSETQKLLNQSRGAFKNNIFWGQDNTNLAHDNTFSKEVEKGMALAEKGKAEILAKYVSDGMFTEKTAIVPFKNSAGKPNPDASKLALLINNKTGDEINMNDATSVRITENKDGTYTASYNVKAKTEEDGVGTEVRHINFERSELVRAVPSFGSKIGADKPANITPTYTFNVQGYKPLTYENISYIEPSNTRALEVYSEGNRDVAKAMTAHGALDYIYSQGRNAEAFNKFEGLTETVFNKLGSLQSDFKLTVKFNADKTKADISLVDRSTEKPIHTIQRPAINNSLDEANKVSTKTPMIYINDIISEIIHDNYVATKGLYNSPAFVRLFGQAKLKEKE